MLIRISFSALAAIAFAALLAGVSADQVGPPGMPPGAAPNAARLEWWREARFGMFIHWGPVSIKGTEIGWSRGGEIPIEEYDNLYKQFNPTKFNADEWVAIAKAAGMKYIVLTTKHHDGFCLWNTKQTDYNVMGSPFGRDVVRELSDACKRQGIRFGTYYSVCDWHHPAFPFGSPGGTTNKPNPDLEAYTQYLTNEVTELIKNYGPLNTLWFDVSQGFDAERGKKVVDYVRSLQPDILVNNRCSNPGDYDTPEQTVGAFHLDRPWETCMTICQQWAWKPNDTMKSLQECLQTLIRCAGGDGNLLFNVGPMPTGEIEGRQVDRLKEMGAWLNQYGASVYGTRGGPYKPSKALASTRAGNSIYLHILKWEGDTLSLPPLPRKVVGSALLTGGTAEVTQTDQAITVRVPAGNQQEIDTLVRLDLDGPALAIPAVRLASKINAVASNVNGNNADYAADQAFDEDPGTRWATDSGTLSAWLELDLAKPLTFDRVKISEACGDRVQEFELQYKVGDEWRTIFAGTTIGQDFARMFDPVTAQQVRLNILKATEGPTIWELQLVPCGRARASNIYQLMDGFAADKAFDGDPTTRWATDGGTHSAWLECDLGKPTPIAGVAIQEAYPGRVQRFELQYKVGDEWKTALAGTTIGETFEAKFDPVTAQHVRLNILEATEGPTISEVRFLPPAP